MRGLIVAASTVAFTGFMMVVSYMYGRIQEHDAWWYND